MSLVMWRVLLFILVEYITHDTNEGILASQEELTRHERESRDDSLIMSDRWSDMLMESLYGERISDSLLVETSEYITDDHVLEQIAMQDK